ncbi:O-antigen ligase family protein [Bacillus wiedmannii]|uniref:O-antigen ligase family protein n=1 Tax=Bacillus wiedmannii TaxID=1890302 RepID=UPI000BF13246|nr:O-antigen ligase family protein [Bacillus wiedmannii]PEL82493.1 hypothetical protein CN609_10295 [Bacillus wiedmannii]
MQKNIFNQAVYYYVFLLFFFLLNMQTLTIKGMFTEYPVKIFHLFSFLMIFLIIIRKFAVPSVKVTNFYLSIFIVTTINFIYDASFNSLIINYLFAFYVYLLGKNAYEFLGQSVYKMLRLVSLIMLLLVLIKAIVNYNIIIDFIMSPYGHPILPWFYGGEANLEATWISLSIVFFINSRYFTLLLMVSILISAIYASRVGIIISLLLLLFKVKDFNKKKIIRMTLGIIIIAIGVLVILSLNPYLVERFFSIGNDPGSLGRLDLWSKIEEAFANRPLTGYGAGNAVNELRNLSGINFLEDNVHNYYIQLILDFGIIPFLIYIYISLKVIYYGWKTKFSDPLVIYLTIFFMVAMIQFRGAETFFWFIFGIFEMSMAKKQEDNKVEKDSSFNTGI